MMERPNLVLGILLFAAAAVSGVVATGLSVVGAVGAGGVASVVLGVVTFCVLLLREASRIPIGWTLLAALAGASLLALARTLLRHRRQRSVLSAMPLEPPGDPDLVAAAKLAGAWPLSVLPGRRAAAFCFGLIRPRVVVTAGLLDRLSPEERDAVLWHEGHHAAQHVPLKILAARIAAGTFFWLPLLRGLRDRYLLLAELAADRAAVERAGLRALAGALSEAALEPVPAGTVGLADAAVARVDRLFDPHAPLPPLVQPRAAVASAAVLGVLVLLVAATRSVGFEETGRLHQMLTTLSLHGLAGMLVGVCANALAAGAAARLIHRARRR